MTTTPSTSTLPMLPTLGASLDFWEFSQKILEFNSKRGFYRQDSNHYLQRMAGQLRSSHKNTRICFWADKSLTEAKVIECTS